MSFFDDVGRFFGLGDEAQGLITVPIADESAAANDPAVEALQAKFSAACQREDASLVSATGERT